MGYLDFMKIYHKRHRVCPQCYSKNYSHTLAGYIFDENNPEAYKDNNHVDCFDCGWKGTVHQLVPEVFPGESVWTHKKTGNRYKVISENAKQKDPETGNWINCVIYAPLYENEIEMFSKERESFYSEFEKYRDIF